ncbi:MAG: xanthine dehydrogenase family protein molybdopterin-binding subunit [Betaproteobacteria bacterium]|nr:xanthine dehydrogenase family protein molybdopterin-binding subunit [Betaproteobacteria bacterium]
MKMNRRSFIISSAAVTGGLALGFNLPFGPRVVRAADGSPEINAWVVIRPDETVVIRIARSEMGQGSLTGLAQLCAEELECDWARVTTEFPTPGANAARKRVWGDYSTGGSRGIRTSHEYVRKGGAAARMMLVKAAADQWNVSPSDCSVSKGVITGPGGRKTTYGKVAEAAAQLPAPTDVPLKDPKDWKVIGKPLKRLDTADKVNGKLVYGLDIKLPGMLNAAIKDSPVFGGKVASFDGAKAQSMAGVKKVVQVGDSGVAVIADTWWHAKTALDQVDVKWDFGENGKVSSESIAEQLKAGLDAQEAFVHNTAGDANAAIASSAKKVSAEYSYPFLNHAPMEPNNATVLYTDERCEVWCPTQNGEAALAAVSEASGLPISKCDVHKTILGGGFGRRGFTDYVRQAVLIAKQTPGTPVKMVWSREEDMTHGRYHPIMQARLTGGLDEKGNLKGLKIRLSGQSILASARPEALDKGKDPFTFQGYWPQGEHSLEYTIENLHIDHAMRNTHILPGFWRGVNINQNAIFLECFIDELAHEAGRDPLEFRRSIMSRNPKSLAVLNAVAEKGGWGKPVAKGHHLGLAHFRAFGSYVAACAEISVRDNGSKVKVHKITAATDCGYAVNPAQIERQIAGSFVYGLSAAFMQECTVKDGAIQQTNFHDFNSMRIAQMPKVVSIVMPSGGFWGGVGEPTICVAAPAVLNAYFRATGKRIRTIPLKNHGIEMV